MLEIGSVLDGKYKILNEIGHGGMSVVYLALNERANKTWAVKEVRKDGGNDSEVVSQGLVAETEMLKKLNHPNLPSIIDVIDTQDTFIIVMDYIEGRSLQSVLNHTGAQDPEKVLEWSKQLCDVLGYLHSRKPAIIYRDMKPANVMLKPDGQVALIDFGTAREYKEHSQGDTTWLGTRGYAAPEQFGGRGQTDARTDIYCLGATMYHLLTGYSPADTQFVIYPLGQLVPSLAGSGLEKVVAKCCAPDPVNRYQSCAELMYALEHVHDEDTKAIRERNKKWRMFVASAAIAAVGLAGIIGFGITGKVAENKSYDSLLENARNTEDTMDKQLKCASLMKIKPGRQEAYDLMLAAMTDPLSGSGETITSSENKVLEDAMADYGDDFRKSNRDGYLKFQMNRGALYLNSFSGNPSVTKGIFENIEDDRHLSDSEQATVRCLKTICDMYIANTKRSAAEASGDESDPTISEMLTGGASETGEKVAYDELWAELEGLAADPHAIDENTGDPVISTLLYRQAALQILKNTVSYQKAGVSKDRMNSMLTAAETYFSSVADAAMVDADKRDSFDLMVKRAQEDVDSAKTLINQNHKTDLGANTAPSSQEEAADAGDDE